MNEYRPMGFRILPPVVKGLLLLNLLFFFGLITLKNVFGIDLTHYLAFHYPASDLFMPHQFVSYMFLHGNIAHIFFNMFSFWMFGTTLENYWGSKRFLTYYMATGIGAAITHTGATYFEITSMQNAIEAYKEAPAPDEFISFISNYFPSVYERLDIDPDLNELIVFIDQYMAHPRATELINDSIYYLEDLFLRSAINVPTVGASGAVFGILLAFGMMFPNALLYIYFAIPIKAKYFVILYGALELYLGYQNNRSDNVAHFAHLGGMLFGFLLLMYWKRKH